MEASRICGQPVAAAFTVQIEFQVGIVVPQGSIIHIFLVVCQRCHIQALISHISIEGHVLVACCSGTDHGTAGSEDIVIPIRQVTVYGDRTLTGDVQGRSCEGVALDHCDLTAPILPCHIQSRHITTQHLRNRNHAVCAIKVHNGILTHCLSRGQTQLACTGNGSIPLMQQIVITAVIDIRRSYKLHCASCKGIGLQNHIGITFEGYSLRSAQGQNVNIHIAALCIPCSNLLAKYI